MSAKDYMIAHTPFESYIVKRTKNTMVMSPDRRPLTEMECLEIAYRYLQRKLAGSEDNTVTFSLKGKPVMKMILLKEEEKNEQTLDSKK